MNWLTDWLANLKDFLTAIAQGVVDWFVGLLQAGWNWLVDQVPTFTFPGWVHDASAGIGQMMGYVGQMSYWVPVELFLPVIGTVAVVFGISMAIRISRIVASFATLGGGS